MIRMFEQHKIRFQKNLEGYWDFQKVKIKSPVSQYDEKMFVPGCWEHAINMIDYRGYGAYRKIIAIEEPANIRLNFKGVSHTADVYFDEKYIGHHYNAFTEFSIILPNVSAGTHEIVVIADNTFSQDSALHIPNDYYCYGGLIKPVVMELVPNIFIDSIKFVPKLFNGIWSAEIEIGLCNISDKSHYGKCEISLNDEKISLGEVEIEPNSQRKLLLSREFKDVQAWETNAPKLYLLTAVLYNSAGMPVDDLIERVGFRTVTVDGNKILLNGKPIFLKGFNRHEDFAMSGCSIPEQLAAVDIAIMKDMNANTVRTCHYPNDERFLDMCDEQGILVWEENHARGLSLKRMQNPNFERQCEDCIREMINSHYNHPSIIIWGILNECSSDTVEGRRMYERQFAQIKSMDTSRPVTFASCRHFNDICLDLVDIVSVNIYYGWYGDEKSLEEIETSYLKELEWLGRTNGSQKPIIISEFGAGAIYGYRSPIRQKWTEERQTDILNAALEVYLNRPEISGTYIWQFADCRVTEEEWAMNRPRTMNNKGVVDEYRRPKLAYSVVKEKYGNKSPILHK